MGSTDILISHNIGGATLNKLEITLTDSQMQVLMSFYEYANQNGIVFNKLDDLIIAALKEYIPTDEWDY